MGEEGGQRTEDRGERTYLAKKIIRVYVFSSVGFFFEACLLGVKCLLLMSSFLFISIELSSFVFSVFLLFKINVSFSICLFSCSMKSFVLFS